MSNDVDWERVETSVAVRLLDLKPRQTLYDVPADTWLPKPRRKGAQPEAVLIADLPLMQLVNIMKRFIRDARRLGSMEKTPIETLAYMACDTPQIRTLAVEANKRQLLIWPPVFHESFIAALTALRLGGRR